MSIMHTVIAIETKSLYGICFGVNRDRNFVLFGKKSDGKVYVGCVREVLQQ